MNVRCVPGERKLGADRDKRAAGLSEPLVAVSCNAQLIIKLTTAAAIT